MSDLTEEETHILVQHGLLFQELMKSRAFQVFFKTTFDVEYDNESKTILGLRELTDAEQTLRAREMMEEIRESEKSKLIVPTQKIVV